MPQNTKNAILVFLKAPVKSTVKTRLAQSLGEDLTLDLYKCFILDVLQKAEKTGELILHYYPVDNEKSVADFVGHYDREPQHGSDLGERMEHALSSTFEKGYEKSVLIGTDIPDIPVDYLHDAFKALDKNDAVIGPSQDGGYVMIGFNREGFSQAVFKGVSWSTSTVCEKTLEIMDLNRISCHKLPLWYDVDTGEDYNALIQRLESGQASAPHTWDFIQRNQFQAHETSDLRHYSCPE
ncbi:MAG: TIGR04282 family arsenosugar biosynthesis glycosyltransferase [Desulfobacteraceae bacterium]|jgi:hypothetical protein